MDGWVKKMKEQNKTGRHRKWQADDGVNMRGQ